MRGPATLNGPAFSRASQPDPRSDARWQHRGHVFEMLTPHLPMRLRIVDAAEIDTPEDFARAEAWLAPRIGAGACPNDES